MAARKLTYACIAFSSILLAGVRPLFAQDEQPPNASKPKPAGTTYPVPLVVGGQQDEDNNNKLLPDTTPLTGIQAPTLGSPGLQHSYWMPGIQWTGSIQSNSYNQTQSSSWLMNNYFVGNVSLLKAWSRSQLAINYSGGGFITTDSNQGNGYYQNLALSQSFQWNRWQLQFLDQFSYLPQSSFGFGGGSGLATPGTGGPLGPVIPGMGNSTVPNQSIYASVGPRYSNASAVQITYLTSPRGSVTLSGSYGLLNFIDPGNVDSNTISGSIGYNYALNRQDTIGAFYRFSAYHYPGQPEAHGDHSFNLAYGRKVTGRMALQLYAGPDFTTSRITATNADSLNYGVNVGANMQYAFRNSGITLNYSHGISGGSGVLTGSSGDQVNSSVTHQLTRIWSGQLNVGYSHNTPIGLAAQTNTQSYNTWTVGGGVSRPLGRNASLGITYTADFTNYGTPTCAGTACIANQTFHYISINFQWHARPLVLP